MTRNLMAVATIIMSMMLTACSLADSKQGEETVLILKPRFFGDGGIHPTPLKNGQTQYIAWTTDEIHVNMLPQQTELEFKDLMTSNGVPIEFHAAVQWKYNDSVKAVSSYGVDAEFFARVLEQKFRMSVRDAVKKRELNEMAINASAAEEVDKEVHAAMASIIKESGAPIDLLGVTLGKANPPDAVRDQRVATAAQQQRQETERQGKLAEDQRKMHEESRAAADKAYLEKMNLSAEQFVQLRQIDTLKEVCAWQRGNCTFVNGNMGGAMFTLK